MQVNRIWREESVQDIEHESILAVALHDGHQLRDDIAEAIALDEAGRLREEDPFTGEWTQVAPMRVIGLMSRFQVDLNRPRDLAVYRTPDDAWGLKVWEGELPQEAIDASLGEYDEFYAALKGILDTFESRFGKFVVYDLHSYNHMRDGADGPPAEAAGHPQVNIGTRTMDRGRWGSVVDRFIGDLRSFEFPGGALDVRENVKFFGGNLCRWVHESYPESGCALAIEFKKFFMDEWTGEPDRQMIDAITQALQSTVPGVLEELGKLRASDG